MLKRKAIDELIKWKSKKDKKPLIVEGVRQCGKTFIIREFAKEYYDNYVELNFLLYNDYANIFSDNLSPDSIYRQISIRVKNANLVPHKTLIFLDEIQKCPNAITALKFLSEDNSYDIICSGSLLGIGYAAPTSFPVGYVERLRMYSLDFEEFCWACGMSEQAISYLKDFYDNVKMIPEGVHNQMMMLFKEYIIVGGMPEVVSKYVESNNYQAAFEIQRRILSDYQADITQYASNDEKAKIRMCFDSIPYQLAQENKKFKYKLVDKKGTSMKYFGALQWLRDAGLISFCYNLSKPDIPFKGYAKSDVFKVYLNDTGLLIAMLNDDTISERIIDGDLGVYKGAIYENIIGEIFTKSGKDLYYFDYNSTLKIDFFIIYKGVATAIEVKSADNTKSKSLDSVINNWGVKQGIKLSSKNIGSSKENILNIPLYMAMFL